MSSTPLELEGPAGLLEARLDTLQEAKGIAVLCHPHPQYGGSMHDAVLATATGALQAEGLSCLRFNFRGVGNSEGHHDAGQGEVEDVLAVMQAARSLQETGALWLLGYSFGACMAWAAACRQAPDGLILIAPPVGLMDFSGALPSKLSPHALLGDRDDFAPLGRVRDWAASLPRPAAIRVLDGADHFFQGYQSDLEVVLRAAISGT